MITIYKWIAGALAGLAAGLTIYFQRNKINDQKETIKDVEKTIEVKTAVHEVNKQSEIKAREHVQEATKDDNAMRDYLTNRKLRNNKD